TLPLDRYDVGVPGQDDSSVDPWTDHGVQVGLVAIRTRHQARLDPVISENVADKVDQVQVACCRYGRKGDQTRQQRLDRRFDSSECARHAAVSVLSGTGSAASAALRVSTSSIATASRAAARPRTASCSERPTASGGRPAAAKTACDTRATAPSSLVAVSSRLATLTTSPSAVRLDATPARPSSPTRPRIEGPPCRPMPIRSGWSRWLSSSRL